MRGRFAKFVFEKLKPVSAQYTQNVTPLHTECNFIPPRVPTVIPLPRTAVTAMKMGTQSITAVTN